MANQKVNLTKRVQIDGGSRYCPVVLAANGRVKPDVVLIDGEPERHAEGAYYLEWRENGKRIRLSVCPWARMPARRPRSTAGKRRS
jgi:integrase/recombinase XerD